MNEKNTKRNSCLLIAAIIVILLLVFAYVASKEVANAFKIADEGLAKTNETFEETNEALMNVLVKHSEYGQTVENIEKISFKYNTFLDSTINELIIQTGGWKANTSPKELANPKNIGIPTRILVAEKLGDKLEQIIFETSVKYNGILKTEFGVDTIQLPLQLYKGHIDESGKTWSEFNFNQLPLMAVLPVLRKFKNNEKKSKAIIYRFIANEK